MGPTSSWLDKIKCKLGLHSWWIAPNTEVWLLGDDMHDVEEDRLMMKSLPPDMLGHAQFCIHCRTIHGVFVNNKLVKLKGVKAVYVE